MESPKDSNVDLKQESTPVAVKSAADINITPSPDSSNKGSGSSPQNKSKGTGMITGSGKRRQSLSKAEVHAIFYCILNDKDELPEGLNNIKIIVVPKFGGNNGLKLSPPPYEYEDGVYVLLRLNVTVPSNLSNRVILHRDLALISERSWSLSGPQYSGENVMIQQRYCTPRWNLEEGDEYCKSTKGSIWTMIGANGEEKYDCRVFHVYHSAKRAANMNDAAAKQAEVAALSPLPSSTKKKRRRKSSVKPNKPPPESLVPETHVSFSDVVGILAPLTTGDPDEAIVAKPKKQKKKRQSPKASEKPDAITSITGGKARQTTRSWSKAEDAKLAHLVSRSGAPDFSRIGWNELAYQMENRSGKQCRERYVNHLKPDRKKGQWTHEEDCHILTLQAALGNQWSKIAADLHGRSDNDVKNRWHSRMRTQKRKVGKPSTSNEDNSKVVATAAERVKARRSKSPKKGTDETPQQAVDATKAELKGDFCQGPPKVGMRVLVRFDGGKMYGGIITKVTNQELSTTQQARFKVMIHYDDGAYEETVFPDKDIRLLPMKNELTENEVLLCDELLNLHNALKKPDDEKAVDSCGGEILPKNQVSEEESHEEHNHKAKVDSSGVDHGSSLQISGGGSEKSCETAVSKEESGNGISSDAKPPVEKEPVDRDSMKPAQQVLSKPENILRQVESPAILANPPSIITAAQGMGTSSILSHGSCPPLAGLNFQPPPAFQLPQAPLFALPTQQQQQLLMAARLLSSVNPGMAVAAIASARQLHNITGAVQQNHQAQAHGGLFLPQLQQQLNNNMFPAARQFNYPPPNGESIAAAAATRQFNYPPPPVTNLSVPGRVERNNTQNAEAIRAAMLAALSPSPSSNTFEPV